MLKMIVGIKMILKQYTIFFGCDNYRRVLKLVKKASIRHYLQKSELSLVRLDILICNIMSQM